MFKNVSSSQPTSKTRFLSKQGRPLRFPPTDTIYLVDDSPGNSRPYTSATEVSVGTPFPEDPSSSLDPYDRLKLEDYFEEMMEKINVFPFYAALQPILVEIFQAENVFVWMNNERIGGYYSPSLDVFLMGEESLIAASAKAKTSIICSATGEWGGGDEALQILGDYIDYNSPQLFFPLFLNNGSVIAVVHLVRDVDSESFNDFHLKIAAFLMRKFCLYGSVVFSPSQTVSFASEFSHIVPSNEIFDRLSSSIIGGFHCKVVDFWAQKNGAEEVFRLNPDSGQFVKQTRTQVGIVSAALRGKEVINEKIPRYHANFSLHGDALPDEPLLICSYQYSGIAFAVALRGRILPNQFTNDDEFRLKAMLPFISRSLHYSTGICSTNDSNTDPYEAKLTDLLDAAAQFTIQLTPTDLFSSIQERASMLTGAQICRLSLLDQNGENFLRAVDLENSKFDLTPLGKGLVSEVVRLGGALRIDNPVKHKLFDQVEDVGNSDIPVKSMMIVPVYSSSESIIGVVSLINKKNNTKFTDEDENSIVTLNVFCGIAIQNANIFQMSLHLTQQLDKFVDIKHDLSKMHHDDNMIKIILSKAKQEINAIRVTLFTLGQNEYSLIEYATIGEVSQYGPKFAQAAVQSKTTVSYPLSSEESNTQHTTPRPSETISSKNRNKQMSAPPPPPIGTLIICTPILDRDEVVLGVLEIAYHSINSPEDVELGESFANLITMTLRQRSLYQLESLKEETYSLKTSMDDIESEHFSVPANLKYDGPDPFTLDFDLSKVEEKDLIKIAFAVFDKFGLMHPFNIDARHLFLFFMRLQRCCGSQCWRESVESAIFTTFILHHTNFYTKMAKNELLCMVVAAFCHNMDSDFFPKNFPFRADVALDCLFQKQAVFEGRYCIDALAIISDPDVNLFNSISEEDSYEVYDILIQLILSANLSQHFFYLHEMNSALRNDHFSLEDPDHRIHVMQMIIKCSDFGVLARPLEVSTNYRDIICQKYYKVGLLERVKNIVFTSTITKDRSHIDKERSRPAILGSIVYPTFVSIMKALPSFELITIQLSKNITSWNGSVELGAESDIPTQTQNPESESETLGPDRTMETE